MAVIEVPIGERGETIRVEAGENAVHLSRTRGLGTTPHARGSLAPGRSN